MKPDTPALESIKFELLCFSHSSEEIWGESPGGTAHMTKVEDLDEYPQESCGPRSQSWEDPEEHFLLTDV